VNDSAPIVAIATAAGRGGIGVVRISGRGLHQVAQRVIGREPVARMAQRLVISDVAGRAIDDGLLLWFPGPASYTGEDVIEFHGHGGPVVLQRIQQRWLELVEGSRLAAPGEFTERAFLNGKLDLVQAEAVADLIDASSVQAASSAVRSLQGVFSNKVRALVQGLIDLRLLVEATLDFPEEEIEFLRSAGALEKLVGLQTELQAVIGAAKQGAALRQGLDVVLVGEPNVGKSSLLNALAADDVAIVTPIAGTTRDRIVQPILMSGVLLNVIDTAGLRTTDDEVEQMGIARTRAAIAQADVVLVLRDARDGAIQSAGTAQVIREVMEMAPQALQLQVANKMDLLESPDGQQPELILISAKTGAGLDELRKRMLALVGLGSTQEDVFSARERHVQALLQAGVHLEQAAAQGAQGDEVLDLVAEELRLAQRELSRITGEFTADDLLGEIFGRFCIGK
jgi:tRNA modification GTPase